MKNYLLTSLQVFIFSNVLIASTLLIAASKDDPTLTTVIIDQFEYSDDNGIDAWALTGQGWIGKDLNKFWFKTEAEYSIGELEGLEVQALYSKAIAPFWDLQIGVRQDFEPTPDRSWGVIGVQGLAPYFFEVDAALFIGTSGRTAARLDAEYELMLTQQWVLTPEVELNVYGKDDPELDIGSGFSDVTAGLRLRYEFRREFALYSGMEWQKTLGSTADIAKLNGEKTSNAKWVFGMRAWL